MKIKWELVCAIKEIDVEEVIQFDFEKKTFAIYHTPSGYYATAGNCTHESVHLGDGLVIDETIECPAHQGQFHIPTGEAIGMPVCINLQTYPIRIKSEKVYIGLPN